MQIRGELRWGLTTPKKLRCVSLGGPVQKNLKNRLTISQAGLVWCVQGKLPLPTILKGPAVTITDHPAPETPVHHGPSHTLSVPATRGKMGTTTFYTANFPLGMVVKLFVFDPEKMASLPVEERHQRALKKGRIPEISEYILNDENDYFFSSLTVSVDVDGLDFIPSDLDDNVGILRLPMETDWIVNDGQHRVAGIADALKQDPTLKNDNVSVVILPDEGLERAQQIFSDLNRTVQKTSRSLDILFDKRSAINRLTNEIVEKVRLFKGRTDKERMSLSLGSASFVTLSGVQSAMTSLFTHVKPEELEANYVKYEKLAIDFWDFATTLIEPWQDIANGTVKPMEARQNFVSSYQVAVAAVGAAGSAAFAKGGDWKETMKPLKATDWRKTNREWQGYIMLGNEVVTRVTTRRALADFLRWKIGFGKKPNPVLTRSPGRPPSHGGSTPSPAKVTNTKVTLPSQKALQPAS